MHFYQPANADDFTIKEATSKSYERIVSALEAHPDVNITLNISGCLIDRWNDSGEEKLIARIGRLIKSGQIELVGSAAYHPFLPLVEVEEIEKQVIEQAEIIKKYFGQVKLRGFFSPEMAFHPKVARVAAEQGYEWIILDEIGYNAKIGSCDTSKVYRDEQSGLKIVFRDRAVSDAYAPDVILGLIEQEQKDKNERIILTATDAELYGLRHEDPTNELEKVLRSEVVKTMCLSDFIGRQDVKETLRPVISTWSTTPEDLYKALPYAMWYNDKSEVHKLLWKLANLAYATVEGRTSDKNYAWARWHLVRGLASCTFWWASGRDLRQVFGPVAWNPDLIELGVNDLTRSIRALDDPSTRSIKIKAEGLAVKLKDIVWHKHWSNYWKK